MLIPLILVWFGVLVLRNNYAQLVVREEINLKYIYNQLNPSLVRVQLFFLAMKPDIQNFYLFF